MKLPLAQVLQAAAPSDDHLLSALHGEHLPSPAAAYLPAGHGVSLLVPSHELPAGQFPHARRVVPSVAPWVVPLVVPTEVLTVVPT